MNKTCFLASPIGASGSEVRRRSDTFLDYVVQPVLEPLGFEVVRADLVARPGIITSQILELLLSAELVIADLSDRNPNVLYEVGVRHSTGKPTILVTSEPDSIPFDVAGVRILVYSLQGLGGVGEAWEQLGSYINFLNSTDDKQSPVLDVRAYSRFIDNDDETDIASSTQQDSVLKTIVERLGTLETRISEMAELSKGTVEPTKFTRDVFIVHGHDGELKNELARLL